MESESESISQDDVDYSSNGDIFYGEVLNERYVLIRKIGYGAFSSVWLTFDKNDQKFYAIKIYNHEDYDEGERELNILMKIKKYNCPNLIKLVDHFIMKYDGEKYICIITELYAGSIYDIMKDDKYENGFPIETVKSIIKQILIGLDVLHNQMKIIHCDIKPENILVKGLRRSIEKTIECFMNIDFNKIYNKLKDDIINENDLNLEKKSHKKKFSLLKYTLLKKANKITLEKLNEMYDFTYDEVIDDKYINKCEIVIADFGSIYKIEDACDREIQTRYYRAPEVILGYKFSTSVDVWSVACMTYELLTGDILFDPEKDEDRSRDIHHLYWIEQLIGKFPDYMINKAPERKALFDKKNNIGGIKNIEYLSPKKILMDGHGFSSQVAGDIEEFLLRALTHDPNKRVNVQEYLKERWLKN